MKTTPFVSTSGTMTMITDGCCGVTVGFYMRAGKGVSGTTWWPNLARKYRPNKGLDMDDKNVAGTIREWIVMAHTYSSTKTFRQIEQPDCVLVLA